MTAPRACATCSGPVGLTLTNSTCTRSPSPTRTLPYFSPASRMASTCRASHESKSEKLMKPGRATHTLPSGSSTAIREATHSAMAIGLIRMGRASFRGRLDANSPCSGLGGRSMAASSTSAGGSSPSLCASTSASMTSLATCPLTVSRIVSAICSARCVSPLDAVNDTRTASSHARRGIRP